MAAVLEFRLTVDGSLGDAQSDPDQSLGGATSGTNLSSTAMNNLFDNVTPTEASSGDTEYRVIDVWNSGDAAAENVSMYMSTETSSADSQLNFAKEDPENTHDGSHQGDILSDESTAPSSGITSFSHYTSASKLSLPNIPASNACRI